MKLRFLCVGGFTCSVLSTLQNVKHEPPRGSGGIPPRKMHALRLNQVLLGHKIAMLRTGSGSLLYEKFHWLLFVFLKLRGSITLP